MITFWRYTNFFPFYLTTVHDLAVNVLNVSSGEAIRRVVFDSLNYLAGFIWFLILLNILPLKSMMKRIIICLAISTTLSFGFGLYQAYVNMNLGNTSFFIAIRRVNAFFTDPNALGVYMSLVIPLFAGAFLFFKRSWKWLFIAVIVVGLVLFPHAGSRSGFFGLLIALIVFAVIIVSPHIRNRTGKVRFKQKFMVYVSIGILAVCLLSVFVLSNKEGILYERISESLSAVSKSGEQDAIFRSRHFLWPSSLHMISNFPLSGVGVGAFTCELPNYYKKYDIFSILPFSFYQKSSSHNVPVDSAGNLYLHISSEMGLIGLFIFMWIFFLILKQLYLFPIKTKQISNVTYLYAGISASLLGMFVIFVFGVHTLNFEIQLTFWLIVGLLYAISDSKSALLKGRRIPKMAFLTLVLIFALSHGWNSSHELSLRERTNKFSLDQRFGVYEMESMDGREFQWTKRKAGISFSVEKPFFLVPVIASHPDIQQNPVRAKISVTKDLFSGIKFLDEIVLYNNSWENVHLDLSEYVGHDVLLYFDISRTWNPKDILGTFDPRDLGIGIGEFCFKSQPFRDCNEVGIIRNPVLQFSGSDWQGRQGGRLYTKGRCWLFADLPPGKYIFRISSRGEKANDEWPYMVVLLDDKIVGGEWISSDAWTDYHFQAEVKGGKHRISIVFVNDLHCAHLREDRNLIVGDLAIYQYD